MDLMLHSGGYAWVWPGQAAIDLRDFIAHVVRLGFSDAVLVAKWPHLSLLDYLSDQPERGRALWRVLADDRYAVRFLEYTAPYRACANGQAAGGAARASGPPRGARRR